MPRGIFIPGNVPSSKNGRRWTGRYFIVSKQTQRYYKNSKKYWIENKKEFLKLLKGRLDKVENIEKKIGKDPEFWGIGLGRQKKIVEIDKQINERKPTEKLSANQNKIYNDNKVVIRDILYNLFMRTKAGRRQTRLSMDAVNTKIELYNKLNDIRTFYAQHLLRESKDV